jgi:acetyl esterase/lipase
MRNLLRITQSILLLFCLHSQALAKESICKETCSPSPAIRTFLFGQKFMDIGLGGISYKSLPKFRKAEQAFAAGIPETIPMQKIINADIGPNSIPISIYIPDARTSDNSIATILFFHGGGWSLGRTALYDTVIKKLASAVPAVVVSADYRLAPENPFPAAVDDCYEVLNWASEHISELGGDASKIVVAGDSAGGNLATVVALKARDEKGPKIKFQALFYPSVNIGKALFTQSAKCFDKGYVLTNRSIRAVRNFYLPNRKDWNNPYASPLQAKNLENFAFRSDHNGGMRSIAR